MSEKFFTTNLTPGKAVAIGIDQSLTGFAFSAVNVLDPEKHATWVYKSEYKGVQRLNDISEWMVSKLDYLAANKNPIYDIAMEGTVLQSQAALVLGELAATVKLTLFTYFDDIPESFLRTPLQIPPMTLKKYAAGKGNAKKQEMLMQIYKRWGLEFNDDNAADAYALARLAGECVIDDVEKSVVSQVKDPKYRDKLY
jgi:Holliday junction resolvasome RuvABC endonuclease subunit